MVAGAFWRVLDVCRERVAVELYTCMGEPVERLQSADPALIAYVRTTPGILISQIRSSPIIAREEA